MTWTPNPNRLDELKDEVIERAAHAIARYAKPAVLKAAMMLWLGFLLMLFTMLLTIRVALTLPLFP